MSAPLVVVGDALLDRDLDGRAERLSPDAPVPVLSGLRATARPGGAGLAATLAARDGRDVTLVTALAPDAAGRELRALLDDAGVEVVDLGLDGTTPEKIRVRAGGTPVVRLDRGTGGRVTAGPAALRAAREAIGRSRAVLTSDYGRGVAQVEALRAAIEALAAEVPVVWDPHPNGPAPTRGATLVTPNRAEAERFATAEDPLGDGQAAAGRPGPRAEPAARVPASDGIPAAAAQGRALARRWNAVYVAVTLGPRGALVVSGGDEPPLAVPAPAVAHGDPCGAGDRFASAAGGALADGRLPSEAVAAAVAAASAFVAAGGAAAQTGSRGPAQPAAGAAELAARVRREGGTVVATGGCFDLLHAGHVQLLERARSLGDCLIVCLNADATVRRLKGPGRPLVGERDRAEILRALRCVDAVEIFEEGTPERVIETLRPHIWCKGGDYAVGDLPEAALVASWGGQAVILPHLHGRSTTRLVTRAREGAPPAG